MSLLRRMFGEDDGPPAMPWDHGPAILEFVRAHAAPGGVGMGDGGQTLPDEGRINPGSGLRWAPGAWDGVATYHMGSGGDDETVRTTVRLVLAYSRQPTAANKAAVYGHVLAAHVVSVIDPVIEALLGEDGVDHGRLYDLARSLVTEAPDREPVKFGVAVLGLFRRPEDTGLFLALGRHDEFTLFCAVALANGPDDPDRALWALARSVTGWGRIHAVGRLARTEDPEVKDWLLREGFRNSVMYEYSAATCARAGGLLAALSGDHADRGLLTAAGEIIQALLAGGPAEGMDDYEDARPVLESYLGHMAESAETVDDFLGVDAVRDYLGGDEDAWAGRYGAGWTAESRGRLRAACEAVLARPEWPARVRPGLTSEDDLAFAHADRAAKALGIDAWDVHWRRLQEKPADPSRWYHVMAGCDEERIGRVVEFAGAGIDLPVVATGPGDELGLGTGFGPHSCLGFVLQELRRFPGRGVKLIEAGLRSPVVRNRNMAVAALAEWPRAAWPAGLAESLERAAGCEPRDDLRGRMGAALRGEPLPP